MKKTLFILFILFFLFTHGQKKHFLNRELKYFDIDSNEISKKQFSKFLKSKSDVKPYQVISYPSKKVLIRKLVIEIGRAHV